MIIGFETERLNRPPSGPKTYRLKLAQALLSTNDDVELVGFQFSDFHHELFDHPRVQKVVLPSIPGFVERRLSRLDVDVLHLGAGLHRYPFLQAINKPIVASIHGIEPLVLEEYDVPLKSGLQKKYIWPQLARFLDQIIVVSDSAKKQLLEYYPVDSSAVTAVYNGIDHDSYRKIEESMVQPILDQYDIREPYFFSVGGFSHRKNPETLITAFDLAADKLDSISLVIAGPGWEDTKADELIRSSAYQSRIHRLGKVPEEHLPPLYNGALGFITPTRHENFGIAIVEAMACGTPVIASGVYAVPEVVGDAGLLIEDPSDPTSFSSAIVDIATDRYLQKKFCSLGIERSHQFTWERCVNKTLRVYRTIL
jgi:glycosyltransferase involved in cell wall biosynthesis